MAKDVHLHLPAKHGQHCTCENLSPALSSPHLTCSLRQQMGHAPHRQRTDFFSCFLALFFFFTVIFCQHELTPQPAFSNCILILRADLKEWQIPNKEHLKEAKGSAPEHGFSLKCPVGPSVVSALKLKVFLKQQLCRCPTLMLRVRAGLILFLEKYLKACLG